MWFTLNPYSSRNNYTDSGQYEKEEGKTYIGSMSKDRRERRDAWLCSTYDIAQKGLVSLQQLVPRRALIGGGVP